MKARTARHACLHSPITVRPPASPFAHMLPGAPSPEVLGSVKGDSKVQDRQLARRRADPVGVLRAPGRKMDRVDAGLINWQHKDTAHPTDINVMPATMAPITKANIASITDSMAPKLGLLSSF